MARDGFDRRLIVRALRRRVALAAVVLVIAMLLGALGASNVHGLARDLTDVHAEVGAQVVDEGSHRELVGGRYSRRWVDVRHVDVELADGSGAARLDSATLEPGDRVTVWVNERTGEARLDAPEAPGFWAWLWAIVVPLLTVLIAWWLIVIIRTAVLLRRFRPRAADFVFVLRDVETLPGRRPLVRMHGTMFSSSVAGRAGTEAHLTAQPACMPAAAGHPGRIEGCYLAPGRETGTVALRSGEPAQWWAADLVHPLGETPAGTTSAG